MAKFLKDENGLTLIEIIISIAILGIIIVSFSSLFVSTIKNNVSAEEKLIANQLAQKYIEEVIGNIDDYIKDGDTTIHENGMIITIKEPEAVKAEDYEYESGSFNEKDYLYIFNVSDLEEKDKIIIENNGIYLNSDSNFIKAITSYPIKIGIRCNSEKTINIENNSEKYVNIYKIYSGIKDNKITINVSNGEVYIYDNIYDNTIANIHKNRVYKIKVTVEKEKKTLVELVRYKTID
ncbi:prepilin-type N-terminal cleavage/methylation domain-containing protein [Crassaminicella indica]|uniref:Prepilin-type N-terminal cleavage/methylation domain-containing protein n=1 Tax=Crassaminicella indica TaxID=2855394 RepID=A0ABX8RAB5_9CLOT|nr:prepilin-type N-terminal cleavage/methylation domain-containing protein [Crassaminicella indica]QXM05999.1 prepilin-type N-terminal cleavage/methylation domain-containing protein [Crassaminicella indica]